MLDFFHLFKDTGMMALHTYQQRLQAFIEDRSAISAVW